MTQLTLPHEGVKDSLSSEKTPYLVPVKETEAVATLLSLSQNPADSQIPRERVFGDSAPTASPCSTDALPKAAVDINTIGQPDTYSEDSLQELLNITNKGQAVD